MDFKKISKKNELGWYIRVLEINQPPLSLRTK